VDRFDRHDVRTVADRERASSRSSPHRLIRVTPRIPSRGR